MYNILHHIITQNMMNRVKAKNHSHKITQKIQIAARLNDKAYVSDIWNYLTF